MLTSFILQSFEAPSPEMIANLQALKELYEALPRLTELHGKCSEPFLLRKGSREVPS